MPSACSTLLSIIYLLRCYWTRNVVRNVKLRESNAAVVIFRSFVGEICVVFLNLWSRLGLSIHLTDLLKRFRPHLLNCVGGDLHRSMKRATGLELDGKRDPSGFGTVPGRNNWRYSENLRCFGP